MAPRVWPHTCAQAWLRGCISPAQSIPFEFCSIHAGIQRPSYHEVRPHTCVHTPRQHQRGCAAMRKPHAARRVWTPHPCPLILRPGKCGPTPAAAAAPPRRRAATARSRQRSAPWRAQVWGHPCRQGKDTHTAPIASKKHARHGGGQTRWGGGRGGRGMWIKPHAEPSR
eukprot:176907-Chlamydomonas_euryale.AAC.1